MKGYFWTTAEIRVLKERYEAGGSDACMPLIDRTRAAIQYQASKLGLSAPPSTWRRSPFEPTEIVDAQIRKLYQGSMKKGDVSALAHRLGCSRDWVSRRAISMGLVSPRWQPLPWSQEELDLLERHDHLRPSTVKRYLARAGYQRTVTAIVSKRKRLGLFRPERSEHSATELGQLMGVHSRAVRRWISLGMLRARRSAVSAGVTDPWAIRDVDVRRMIIDYTAEIDTRKMDKWYLVGVLSGADGAKGDVMREAG